MLGNNLSQNPTLRPWKGSSEKPEGSGHLKDISQVEEMAGRKEERGQIARASI